MADNTENAETSIEKTEKAINKVNDFWAQHNVGTRASLITFILAYVASVIATFFTTVPDYVLDTTGWLLFAAFMTVTLGINGVKQVGAIIIAVKTGKAPKEKGE